MKTEKQKHEPGLPLEVKPLKWRKFRLTLLFAFTAIVSITITTTLVVNRVAAELAESSAIRSAEENAVRDAEYFVSDYRLANDNPLLTLQELVSPPGLPSTFLTSLESLNIVKFTLLDVNGVAVWSTDPASIGKIDRTSPRWPKAVSGDVVSKLDRNKTFVSLSGSDQTTDIVETYLPLRSSGSGKIIGVMEVYSDVGVQLAIGIDATKATIRQTTFASMGGLFLILLGFIVAADITNHRSNERQMDLAAEARQMLDDRLQQQFTDNERLEAEVIVRKRAEEEQQRLAQEKQIVADIGQIITSRLDIDKVYDEFAREMQKLVGFDKLAINTVDWESRTYTLKYLFGPEQPARPLGSVNSLEGSQVAYVISSGQTIIREDLSRESMFPSDQIHQSMGLLSNIAVPLISRGRVIGAMGLRSKQVGVYGPREQAILEALANQIAPAVANAQLYERTKQIQEEVHRLSLAVATMNDGLLIVDLDGRIFSANPAAEQMYGFEPGGMKGVEIWTLRSEANDITGRQQFEAVKAGGWSGELIARRKNGDEFPIRVSAVPVSDEEGQPAGTMGLNIDITERKQAEERLKAFAADLERSNRELQEFAYVASHDLQEPLRKVEAFGDRLRVKYGEVLTGQGQDYLERMLNASGRMRTLINDLLSFSRVTTKAQPFVLIDLAELVAEVVSDLEVTIERAGGRVEVGELPTIDGDPTQMRQLLQNLIGNGLKFRRPEEPPVVKVHSQLQNGSTKNGGSDCSEDGCCQIVVEDNGIGFDEKYLDRIFNVFQRLHGRDQYEGTGVGLAVCRKIVERHGGSITATSLPGQGAKFIVTLPIKQPEGGDRRRTNGTEPNLDVR